MMIQIDKQLLDFAKANQELFWQRQATLAGATMLAAYYLSIKIALVCYVITQIAELFDSRTIKKVLKWDGQGSDKADHFVKQLTISSVLCSFSIVVFATVVALADGPSIHLGPLFFLLAAILYSAMNNCQIPRVLLARLIIYSAGLVFIPVYDLLLVRPPFHSDLWMQLGVVLFVLYFLIECSRKFLSNYTTGLAQIEELRIERDRVSEAYKVQTQFVSVVSHELRTPLTSVRASLDLLNNKEMGELPEELSSVARIGQKSSNHLAVLIDDLLDFQRLNSGKMAFKFSKVELGQFIREAVEVNRAFGEAQDVTIRIKQDDAPIYVNADADRMMQVVGNVLSNAIKFSDSGGVVDVSVESSGENCRISVQDEGVGIPENSQSAVFDPFKQIDGSDKREFGGTGLGMSITKKILESHDGSISYTSELGVGTTFFIDLKQLMTADQAPLAENSDPQEARLKTSAKSLANSISIFPGHDENDGASYGGSITPETS